MEHSGSIPVEATLAKADTLYAYLLRLLSVFAFLFSSLLLLGRVKFHSQNDKQPKQGSGNHFSMAVLEALLVLPLMLAFGLWWRVALATPQDTSSTL